MNREFWLTMAWFDIRGRYRRTILGPFWTVANGAVFVLIVASVYSLLWRISLETFLPFVAAGYFVWIFISTSIAECCTTFYANGETLKTILVSPAALLMRVITRNLIVFAHNFAVFAVLALLFNLSVVYTPLAIAGMMIVALTTLGFGTALAFLCCRYRDFEPIVQSLLQVLFFISPILWQDKLLPEWATGVSTFNPVFHLLSIVRDPMLGILPPLSTYLAAGLTMTVALALGTWAYQTFRGRLAYWL